MSVAYLSILVPPRLFLIHKNAKTNELIGLAIAVALGCEHCMEWHTIGALEQGASEDEIAETLAVTMVMTGGPGLVTWPETVIETLKKYKEK